MKRTVLGALVALTTALTVEGAWAQERGFSIDRFDPSQRGSDWFSTESLDHRGVFRPAAGLVLDGAYRPLAIYDRNGNVQTSLVKDQVYGHVGVSVVLWDALKLGANLPVVLFQDGNAGNANGVSFSSPNRKFTAGDASFAADVVALGRYGDPFVLGFGLRVFFPSGRRVDFTGDGNFRVEPRVEVAGTIGIFEYAARLGAQYRKLDQDFGGTTLGSEFRFAASAGLRFFDRALLIGPEVFGSTIVSKGDEVFKKTSTPADAVMGAHVFAGDFRFGVGAGPGLTRGFGSPVVRYLATLEWAPAYEEKKAPPPSDRDHDGILDGDDACVDVAGVRSDDPAKNGCPPDKDGDGIYDDVDACIDVPGVKSDDPKKNGCPADKDGDGIYDKDDACIDVPGEKSDDPKKNGCPPDKDNDGIVDKEDACPTDPGPADPDPKQNGCPVKTKYAEVKGNKIVILDKVNFASNSDVIVGAKSFQVLDSVIEILKKTPAIKKVRVEGHTDNKGAPDYNKKLSQRRAESVKKYLVGKGIDADRLDPLGMGQDVPIGDNDTELGRAQNRRVEFHIEGDVTDVVSTPSTPSTPTTP